MTSSPTMALFTAHAKEPRLRPERVALYATFLSKLVKKSLARTDLAETSGERTILLRSEVRLSLKVKPPCSRYCEGESMVLMMY